MTIRAWCIKKIAEVFALDVAGMIAGFLALLILGVLGRDMWPAFALFAFFAGSFFARMVFTPYERKIFFGLKYISEEELEDEE